MYTFHALTDRSSAPAQQRSRLMLEPSQLKQQAVLSGRYGEYMARFRGALIQLFGEPSISPGDAEYAYEVEASAGPSQQWIMEVLAGASGPSIHGDVLDTSLTPVAEALRELIETTLPADFEATLIDEDTDGHVIYGCRNGVCYWRET